MKKLILSFALVAGLSLVANAQILGAVKKLSIGIEAGLPTKGFNLIILAGGSLQFEQSVAKSFNLIASAGYMGLLSKAKGASGQSGYFPIKAGGKYYFGGNFYGAGEVGASISTELGDGAAFLFAPGIGASFKVANKSNLEFGLRYETWSNNGSSSFVGLRAAYAFGL